MASDPGEVDTKRSISDTGADEHSHQLANYAVPRAGREAVTVDLAFGEPLTAATRTSGFLERTAMDRERICHGKSVFKDRKRAGAAPA